MYLLIKVNNKNCYFRYSIKETKQNIDANEYFELVKDYYKNELNLDISLINSFSIKQDALKMLHKLDPNYQAPINHRDNNGEYHSKKNKQQSCSHYSKIRVPSLKRSRRTWKKFYELFPSLKGKDFLETTTYYHIGEHYEGYANKKHKLKKI